MVPAAENGCGKGFSDITELHDLYYSTILDCRVAPGNIYSKIISKTEIAVFGDYRILVFYRRSYVGEERNYASFTVRKNICEIIPCELADDEETSAVLSLQPSCDFQYVNYDRNHSYWRIEVRGSIEVIRKTPAESEKPGDDPEKQEQPVSSPSQASSAEDTGSHVWQFEGNDDIPVEQLMEMDLESLKNFRK